MSIFDFSPSFTTLTTPQYLWVHISSVQLSFCLFPCNHFEVAMYGKFVCSTSSIIWLLIIYFDQIIRHQSSKKWKYDYINWDLQILAIRMVFDTNMQTSLFSTMSTDSKRKFQKKNMEFIWISPWNFALPTICKNTQKKTASYTCKIYMQHVSMPVTTDHRVLWFHPGRTRCNLCKGQC